MLSDIKSRNKTLFFFLPHQFAKDTYSELKPHFNILMYFYASTKEISIFQNPFNCAIVEFSLIFHLEAIHLQCNDMTKKKI